ncbi:MAG: hypothetical protein KF889_18280 [Alphaproteobacteria bacterium]|nr:hypothetical protein [Alphaproteobacteria bacterium]MCW5743984.1 hypothetical protein [Alphaproteobacteria bacterium]
MADHEERVARNTAEAINRRIRAATAERLAHYADNPEEIDARLRELDDEWDIERAIEANASTIAFAGIALGVTHDRRWLLLPALVSAFLFQHATQGWCPPVPVLRRLGVRTADEINQERYALKALRGDFEPRPERTRLTAILEAIGVRPNGGLRA